jgi:hypothetical protein
MSTDYKAMTIIGIKIPNEKLYVTTHIRGCKHKETAYKHCPECGKPMWISQKEDSPAYVVYQDTDKFAGLNATTGGTDEEDLFVGKIFEAEPHTQFNVIPDFDKIKAEVRLALDPLNLFDEKKFGIYTVLYCSY